MGKLLKKVGVTLAKTKKENVKTLRKEYISDIKTAKEELDNAISNFSYATEPELIDLYTYQIKAAQVKYNYHLMRAKRNIS